MGNELDRLRQLEDELGADVAVELIDLFICDGPEQLSTMRQAATGSDAEALKRAAHSMKGSCGNLGLQSLSDKAAELERHTEENGCSQAETHISTLERLFDAIKGDLLALRGELEARM
jgi:HPt (histidine-containing phosphotransfer) domain-containing protein